MLIFCTPMRVLLLLLLCPALSASIPQPNVTNSTNHDLVWIDEHYFCRTLSRLVADVGGKQTDACFQSKKAHLVFSEVNRIVESTNRIDFSSAQGVAIPRLDSRSYTNLLLYSFIGLQFVQSIEESSSSTHEKDNLFFEFDYQYQTFSPNTPSCLAQKEIYTTLLVVNVFIILATLSFNYIGSLFMKPQSPPDSEPFNPDTDASPNDPIGFRYTPLQRDTP